MHAFHVDEPDGLEFIQRQTDFFQAGQGNASRLEICDAGAADGIRVVLREAEAMGATRAEAPATVAAVRNLRRFMVWEELSLGHVILARAENRPS